MNQDFPLTLTYDDVLLVPQYSEVNSRSDIDLSTQISPKIKLKMPLISTKMDTVTGVEMAIALGKMGSFAILPRFESITSQANKVRKVKSHNVLTAAAIGIKDDYIDRAQALVNSGADIINIDVAHGHLKKTIEATAAIKQIFGDKITLLAGITSTYECAVDLYTAGADCLLVGVGAGATCTTRIQTGHGVPSITSLLETSRAAKKFKKTFMPDAGMRNSGDVVKALATGACAVVSGRLFAGAKETPPKIEVINGKKYKQYNGSASLKEKQKHSVKSDNYTNHIEGASGYVAYAGPVSDIVESLLAGIRSGLSYSGATSIKDLHKKAKFVRITRSGSIENGHHDILIA